MIIFKKIKVSFINRKYTRQINTDKMYELMEKMAQNNTLQKAHKSVSNDEFLEKMQKLKEKVEIKTEFKKYDTIKENLSESLNTMKELRENFKILKEKSAKIDIKVKNEDQKIDKTNIDILNEKNKIYQDNKVIDQMLEEKYDKVKEINEKIIENRLNVKKSIFDIEWLQPFLDFMHSHSTIILTVGSGIVMGGMWYMNSVGIINIGSLLAKLGITIFSGNSSQNSNMLTRPIEITQPISQNQSNNEIGRGFFRQLGQKVLELIDIYIERMKDKRQNYK